MTLDILFWIVVFMILIFGAVWGYNGRQWPYGPFGGVFILFLLICMLGWRVFGPAVK